MLILDSFQAGQLDLTGIFGSRGSRSFASALDAVTWRRVDSTAIAAWAMFGMAAALVIPDDGGRSGYNSINTPSDGTDGRSGYN
ncbi:hypothetical protein VTJ04DRAFT_5801 [Mycothermus thermophilus]|uniref:uncharacterized protein n=1 Tax=Humicola insolens TaxID=85995 RepID=UPI003743354F